MADIPNATQNVTIYDEQGFKAEVNPDNELLVHDIKANTDRDRYDWKRFVDESKAYVMAMTETEVNLDGLSPYILIDNPVAANKTIYLYRIFFAFHKDADDNIKSGGSIYLYYNPTVTVNGTARTPVNLKTRATASSVNVYQIPTITSNGTYYDNLSAQDYFSVDDYGLVINPGEKWLVLVEPVRKPRNTLISLYWGEE